jgi:hypothetical protein
MFGLLRIFNGKAANGQASKPKRFDVFVAARMTIIGCVFCIVVGLYVRIIIGRQ